MTKSILTILLISTLLIFSVALNYVFYHKAFLPSHKIRLDPLELKHYASRANLNVEKATKPIVLFYGDSRSLSWPFINNDKYFFLNRSIGNQTSTQVNGRFKNDVASNNPDVIVVQVCVNDLKMIPLFPNEEQEIIKNCLSNIEEIINKSKSINSKLVLTTVFPLGDVSFSRKLLGIKEKPIIQAIDIVNSHIKTLASKDTLVFDSYGFLVGSDKKIEPSYSKDWLHLNEIGYQHLNKHFEKFINQELQ